MPLPVKYRLLIMWLIAILIIAGVLLIVTELVLLPGFSVAGIFALICYGGAAYLAFDNYGPMAGVVVLCIIAALSIAAVFLSLRARTWQRLALNDKIESTSQQLPSQQLKVGQKGVAATRLAPSGKIVVDGHTYEARTLRNTYVDEKSGVEVVDFENFTVIVKETGKKSDITIE